MIEFKDDINIITNLLTSSLTEANRQFKHSYEAFTCAVQQQTIERNDIDKNLARIDEDIAKLECEKKKMKDLKRAADKQLGDSVRKSKKFIHLQETLIPKLEARE